MLFFINERKSKVLGIICTDNLYPIINRNNLTRNFNRRIRSNCVVEV